MKNILVTVIVTLLSANSLVTIAGGVQQLNAGNNGQLSSTCQFTNGPKAGQVANYKGIAQPIPVGSPCTDGQQSFGTAIPDNSNTSGNQTLSSTCQFNQGPRSGQTQSYKGMVQPIPIGSPCTDGQQSFGNAIPD